jgi:hypothetical protein
VVHAFFCIYCCYCDMGMVMSHMVCFSLRGSVLAFFLALLCAGTAYTLCYEPHVSLSVDLRRKHYQKCYLPVLLK